MNPDTDIEAQARITVACPEHKETAAQLDDTCAICLLRDLNRATTALATARAQAAAAQEALSDIINPIAYLRKQSEKEGGKLNGAMAVELSKDVSLLQEIARAALTSPQGTGEARPGGWGEWHPIETRPHAGWIGVMRGEHKSVAHAAAMDDPRFKNPYFDGPPTHWCHLHPIAQTLPASAAWRPIAEAPKDGTWVSVRWRSLDGIRFDEARWNGELWVARRINIWTGLPYICREPLDWQPLPSPPIAPTEGKE
jgi:hypothetical protein